MPQHTDHAPFGQLPGRDYWQARLAEQADAIHRHGGSLGLLLVELRAESDEHGDTMPLSAGVNALAAERLRRDLRGRDVVCQLEPGRFALLLVGAERKGVSAAAGRLPGVLRRAVAECLPVGLLPLVMLGAAVAPDDGSDPAQLMAKAECELQGWTDDSNSGMTVSTAGLPAGAMLSA